jgi:tetratricopeptide (TPR) repeat protein
VLRAGVIDERFVIEEIAGRGGMGSVYRARDRVTGARVALKLLGGHDGAAVERFLHEARILAGIDHPHVVRYVAHGITGTGDPYLAMEWLDGESLEGRLSRGPLDPAEVVALGRRVADALGAAHTRGVVHRDVKPSNLYIAGGDVRRVKVLDFGIARLTHSSRVLTRTGALVGTPGYMAPEQAQGDRPINARADVFALGAVLFECLAGRPAFEGAHPVAILSKLLSEDAPRLSSVLPEIPPALEALVARMLSRDPEVRPDNGAAVARALEVIASGDIAPPSRFDAPEVITGDEQRLLSIVIAVPPPEGSPLEVREGSTVRVMSRDLFARAGTVTARHGARLDSLLDGSVIASIEGGGHAADQAARAARCAIALRALVPGARVVVGTGRGETGGPLPVGPVVVQAAALLEEPASAAIPAAEGEAAWPSVRVDAVTRGLIEGRFEVRPSGAGWALIAERGIDPGARMLLGKPSPCVGRERELRTVCDLLEASFGDEAGAQAVVVLGPAGIGKSRLRHEVMRLLSEARPDLAMVVGRGDTMSAGSAFALVGSAIRDAAGMRGGEPIVSAQSKLSALVGRYLPAPSRARVAAFLGEMVGARFEGTFAPGLEEARRDAARMSDEIARAYLEFVDAACACGPTLLVLEDLHWADAASIKLIDRALGELGTRPFAALALARPDVQDIFPDLWAKRPVQTLRLGALSRRAAEQIVRGALGGAIGSDDIARVVDRAAGNAFYLEELVRAVADGRGERLPETVLAMVEARLEALPPVARRFLRAASVFGETFWVGGVCGLLGEGEESVREILPWLAERELVVRHVESRFAGDDEYAFRHALLREGAYATLVAKDRALGHRLAARWLVQQCESSTGPNGQGGSVGVRALSEHHAVIGEHFARGEDYEGAFRHFDRAGDEAARLSAGVEARRHFTAALAALDRAGGGDENRRRRVDTVIKKASVSAMVDPAENLALLEGAEATAQELAAALAAPADRRRLARVHFWMGRAHWYRGAYPEAARYFRAVLDVAEEVGDEALAALPSSTIGRLLVVQGDFVGGAPLLARALGSLAGVESVTEWILNAGFLGIALAARGQGAAALELREQCLARAEAASSPTNIAVSHSTAAVIDVFVGENARARLISRIAVDAAELSGDQVYAYLGCGVGAWADSRLGRHASALAEMMRARAIAARLGQRFVMADWFLAVEAELALAAGQLEQAIEFAEAAAEGVRATGGAFAEALARRTWGVALAAMSPPDLEEAALRLEESLRLFEIGDARMEAARARVDLAKVLAARGDSEEACREFGTAAHDLTEGGAFAEAAVARSLEIG